MQQGTCAGFEPGSLRSGLSLYGTTLHGKIPGRPIDAV